MVGTMVAKVSLFCLCGGKRNPQVKYSPHTSDLINKKKHRVASSPVIDNLESSSALR